MAPTLFHSQQQTVAYWHHYICTFVHLATPQMQFDQRVGNVCGGACKNFAFRFYSMVCFVYLSCAIVSLLPYAAIHLLWLHFTVWLLPTRLRSRAMRSACSLLQQRSPRVFDLFKVGMFLCASVCVNVCVCVCSALASCLSYCCLWLLKYTCMRTDTHTHTQCGRQPATTVRHSAVIERQGCTKSKLYKYNFLCQ